MVEVLFKELFPSAWLSICHKAVALSCINELFTLLFPCRACASSETESEAGDIMDQQFEEMNNKLNAMTDPTGFLRMVSRNNLLNR